ncbi:hypothetical protein PENTCL1PPCAC_15961, partial [Pristionchus entomophagus]
EMYNRYKFRIMYGVFAGACLLSNLVFLLMPAKNVQNSIAVPSKNNLTFSDQMKKIFHTFTDIRALELTPLFCFIGLSTSFFLGAYPASLIFTRSLTGYVYLPALYLATVGVGEILMGIIISVAASRLSNTFAQLPCLIIGSILFLTAMVLALLTTPPMAINSPSNDPTPLLDPNPIICLVIALLLGMSDNCFNTSRTVLCALVIPDNIVKVYSMSKFFQNLASSIVYFCMSMIYMPVYIGLVSFFSILSIFFYWRASARTIRNEKEVPFLI